MTNLTYKMTSSNLNNFFNKYASHYSKLWDKDFGLFDQIFHDNGRFAKSNLPYNTILTDDNQYRIEIALAGYKKEDIVVYIINNMLHVEVDKTLTNNNDPNYNADSTSTDESSLFDVKSYPHYIHKGISKKYYHLEFGLPIGNNNITSKYEDGLLTIDITLNENDPKERKTIDIK